MAYLLLSATAFVWGANAVFARMAVGEVSPILLVALRWLIVSALVALLAGAQVRRDWALLRTGLPLLFAMGALGFAGFNALFYVAAHHTTAINIGIIQGVTPVLIVLGAFVLHGTRVGALQMLGVLIALTGVVVVATGGEWRRLVDTAFNRGDLLIVTACVLYAGYALGLRARPPASAFAVFGVMAFAAFLAALPLAAIELAQGASQLPTAKGWLLIGAIALLPSLIGQLFFIRGVELIGPGRAGMFTNLVPVTASGLAVLTLGESFRAHHALALMLVLGGIACSEIGSRRLASRVA